LGDHRFKSVFKFENTRLRHRPSVRWLCSSPSSVHARARPVRRLQWGAGYACPTCGWDLHHLWRTRAVPLANSAWWKARRWRLSTGDLVPTWFQLEPTVHTAITAQWYRSMESSILRTSISSAATPAGVCGTSRKGRTAHRVRRC